MSRSYRKSPITGHAKFVSEKHDKRIWHKRMRTCNRDLCQGIRLQTEEETEGMIFPLVSDVSNPYDFAKDGKCYQGIYDSSAGWLSPYGKWYHDWDSYYAYYRCILAK